MNAEQLNAIKERAEKATPGPWKWNEHGDVIDNYGSSVLAGRPDGTCRSHMTDAEFIAISRQDIPTLVAEIERLTTVKHRLNSEVEKYRKLYEGTAIQLSESDSDNERLRAENKRLEDKVLDVAKKSYSDGYFDGKSDYY